MYTASTVTSNSAPAASTHRSLCIENRIACLHPSSHRRGAATLQSALPSAACIQRHCEQVIGGKGHIAGRGTRRILTETALRILTEQPCAGVAARRTVVGLVSLLGGTTRTPGEKSSCRMNHRPKERQKGSRMKPVVNF